MLTIPRVLGTGRVTDSTVLVSITSPFANSRPNFLTLRRDVNLCTNGHSLRLKASKFESADAALRRGCRS